MLPAEGSGPGSPHADREARDTRAASPMDGSPFLSSRPGRNKAADRERPDRSGSSGLRETCTPATPGRETLAGRPALAAGRGSGEVSGRSADASPERFPPSRGDARHGEHAPSFTDLTAGAKRPPRLRYRPRTPRDPRLRSLARHGGLSGSLDSLGGSGKGLPRRHRDRACPATKLRPARSARRDTRGRSWRR